MAIDKEHEIGALWVNTSGTGVEYWSGNITKPVEPGTRILAFKNQHKQPGEKSPDYRLYLSVDREAPKPPPAPASVSKDDIPF